MFTGLIHIITKYQTTIKDHEEQACQPAVISLNLALSQKGIKMDNIINAIQKALGKLKEEDGVLFQCPQEVEAGYDQRKLHEVCINHKLAIHLEHFLFQVMPNVDNHLFTDIEFNREGINLKNMNYNGQDKLVRPDIIIHNRKSGEAKENILVVECKKEPVSKHDLNYDTFKIEAFLKDPKYKYKYGLQVLYSEAGVSGTFFYLNNEELKRVEM